MQTTTFEQYLYQMHHSKATVKSYLYTIRIFLGERSNALSLKYKDIINYLSEKEKSYNNPNIKKQVLPGIKKYYDYLIEIDREERYADLKLRNQAVMSLLIYQGLSVSELANLKAHHVDLDKGTIFIKDSPKTSRRHLEIMPKQYRILDRYLHESRKKLLRAETDVFAIGKLGTPLTADDINYLVSTYKPLFPDRNLNPQTIRQSVISNWMNEKKMPLEQVQLMAGHRWISSTVKYRQNNIEEQRELMNKWFPLG
jgi:site-specific recombinase XerD